MSLQEDIQRAIKDLRDVSVKAKRQTSYILGKRSKSITDALFASAPHGTKVHKRYAKAGLSKGVRAPNGRGTVVAIYRPGNLATSFKTFRFRGAKYTVQVGAKFEKRGGRGTYGPGTGQNDAYYTHIVEQREPFIIPTWLRMKNTVETNIVGDLKRLIERANR